MSSTTSDLAIIKSTTKEEEDKEEQSREEEDEEEEKADNNLHPQEGDQRQLIVMSLHGVVQPPPLPPPSSPPPQSPSSHHLPGALLDEISSPINSQIFDFCNPDIFSETLQNSDAASSPDGCVFENHNSSTYVTNLSLPLVTVENDDNNSDSKFNIESLDISNFLGDQNDHNTSTTSSTTTTAATTATNPSAFQNGLSIIFDSQDDIDDISASIDFSSSSPFSGPPPYTINPSTTTTTTQQDQYQIPLNNGISPYPTSIGHTTLLPLISSPPPPLGPIFEEECLSPILPFLRLNTTNASFSSCSSFADHPSIGGSFMHGNPDHGLGVENSTMFSGSSFMGSELQGKELDSQGDSGGIFCPDQLTRVYSSGDKQAYSNESSQLVGVATTSSAPLATEITSVEDSSFKVAKLSTEQRKEKIHRYMKKRNERNFSKKIKYACRKTLADSRPRVRGRFAKNDDFMETHRRINGHHNDDDYDDVAMVKEEHDLVDSDIFSHISGVNSFKCNYQIQSWI